MKQLRLDGIDPVRTRHGGELSVKRRKEMRPIALKRPMHVVLRASCAKGRLSLLRHQRYIEQKMARVGAEKGVRVYEMANSGNHLHLLVRATSREGFRDFLRIFAGHVAQKVTGACRGKPFGRRFWDLLAFSRIVEWGNAFQLARAYVFQNRLETLGLIPYRERMSSSPKRKTKMDLWERKKRS